MGKWSFVMYCLWNDYIQYLAHQNGQVIIRIAFGMTTFSIWHMKKKKEGANDHQLVLACGLDIFVTAL